MATAIVSKSTANSAQAEKDRNRIVEENLGLVHSIARRFQGKGVEYEDLFQNGCIGLIKAVKGFDPSRGTQLSTYAVPVIMGEIRRLFRDDGTVKVSRRLKDQYNKIIKIQESLTKKLKREPKLSEIAQATGLDISEIAQALAAGSPVLSLTVEDENEDSIERSLPVDFPENEITSRISLERALSCLNPEDKKLIELRFVCNYTQAKTAGILGMTQVQVSRRERKLLHSLRYKLL